MAFAMLLIILQELQYLKCSQVIKIKIKHPRFLRVLNLFF